MSKPKRWGTEPGPNGLVRVWLVSHDLRIQSSGDVPAEMLPRLLGPVLRELRRANRLRRIG